MNNIALDAERRIMEEVYGAARWLAAHGLKGRKGDPLPDLMSERACLRINADPGGFAEMVRRAAKEMK